MITLVQVISGGKAAGNLTHEEGKNEEEVEVFDNSLESGYTRDWFDALASSGMDTVGGNLSLNHGNDISFEDNGLFDNSLQPLSDDILEGLPSSFINADVSSFDFKTTNGSAQEILSIFFVLQMIGKGHPSSKPYIKEICGTVYPSSDLDHCHKFLKDAVSKYDQELLFNGSEFNTSNGKIFLKSYQSLAFQMNEILKNSSTGVDMVKDLCIKTARKVWVICQNDFERGIEALNKFWYNTEIDIKVLDRGRGDDQCWNPCNKCDKALWPNTGALVDINGVKYISPPPVNPLELCPSKSFDRDHFGRLGETPYMTFTNLFDQIQNKDVDAEEFVQKVRNWKIKNSMIDQKRFFDPSLPCHTPIVPVNPIRNMQEEKDVYVMTAQKVPIIDATPEGILTKQEYVLFKYTAGNILSHSL